MQGRSDAPAPPPLWFQQATSITPDPGSTVVAGCRIAWLGWGDPVRQTIVLLHGGAANAYWWSFIAPLFLPTYHVVAVDLSGHGDSGRRTRYSFGRWVEEVMAVVRTFPGGGAAVLAAHSMSGVVAAVAAASCGDELAGAILVDSPLHRPSPADLGNAEEIFSEAKSYASQADAQRRFRVLPAQPVSHPALVRHVAGHSTIHRGDGWTWKFDPQVFTAHPQDRPQDLGAVLSLARCPVACVVGAHSHVVPEPDRERLRRLRSTLLLEVSEGHHHLMFDQPLALVEAIGRVLAGWGLPAGAR